MTATEWKIANSLINCTFLPGSYDKKFVQQLGNWKDRDMTLKGRLKMIELLHKYRRQIPDYEKLQSKIKIETDSLTSL